jgi:hypothetical protein
MMKLTHRRGSGISPRVGYQTGLRLNRTVPIGQQQPQDDNAIYADGCWGVEGGSCFQTGWRN